MTIRLLGTAAAEGIPAFCSNSRVSRYARQHRGRDIRTRSGAIIDCCLKIDLPPDTLMQMQRDNLNAADWTALIFTHSDDDHFCPSELQYCLFPFNEMDHLGFTIYGNDAIIPRIKEMYPEWPMDIILTRSFQCFRHEKYLITPIKAHHKPDEDSHNLIFQKDNKTLLYATDTGIWPDETWRFLTDFKIDLLIIECTEGFSGTDYEGHLDARECVHVIERLRGQGSMADDCVISTTHHSHNGEATHAELEAFFTPMGIQVGFDGAELRV